MKRPLFRTLAIVIFLAGIIFGRPVLAQDEPKRGPSTPEERAKAVKIAHDLENDPLAKDAKDQRQWVMKWIIDIPDITVDVCFEYFGDMGNARRGHTSEVANQMVISSAAFMIEHPSDAKNEQAVALAGLQGSIKAYQSILKQDSSWRWAQMDKLVVMREQGKLDDFVSDTRRKCSQKDQKDQEEDPDTMHASIRF